MPSVTYPRATWRLQAEQEAVPVCEEEKNGFLCLEQPFMTCYFEKLVIAVNRNLCGYCINNVVVSVLSGHVLRQRARGRIACFFALESSLKC